MRLPLSALSSLVICTLLSGTATAVTPVWSAKPVKIASTQQLKANGDALSGQQVAVNGTGQAVTAWVKGTTAVQARVRFNNKWLNAVTLVPSVTGQTANVLALAQSSLGEAVALFSVQPNAAALANVQASFYRNGQWSVPAAIPATTGTTVLNAQVRYDDQTTLPATPTATLVWVEKTTTSTTVSCAIMTALGKAAGGWDTPQKIGEGCYTFIQLAVNKRGEAAVALGAPSRAIRGGSPAIVTSRNTAGVWTGLTDLGSLTYGTPPVVAIPDNGAAIAVFSDALLGVQWSRRSPTDGSWTAKATIDGGVPAVPTGIAMSAKGAAVVVYNSYYPVVGPAPLQAATLKAGSNTWKSDPVAPYITDPSGNIGSFQIAATPAGSFVVGWVDNFPTLPLGVLGSSMGVSVLMAGTTAWVNTTLDGDMTGTYTEPSPTAVAAATGRAVTVWNNTYYDPSFTYTYSEIKASASSIK